MPPCDTTYDIIVVMEMQQDKTATIRVRVDPQLREGVERMLEEEARIPNETTRKTFQATDAGEDLCALRMKTNCLKA